MFEHEFFSILKLSDGLIVLSISDWIYTTNSKLSDNYEINI